MDKDRIVAWFCTYTPLEMLDAAGLIPSRHFGDPQILESADALLHPAICPYARACLAHELKADGPHHALFINSCDAMRRLYDTWKDAFSGDFIYLMDLPRNQDGGGERMLAEEMKHLAAALRERWGVTITSRELLRACVRREESRLAYLDSTRGAGGGERLRSAMRLHTGLEAGDDSDGERTRGGTAGTPILLTGNLLNPEGLVTWLERAGARVVWTDLCNGDRAFCSSTMAEGEDMDELLASLSAAYLERHPCARMSDSSRRYDLLVETTRRVGARGIVYASLKFCDSYLYDYPLVEDRLKEEGIPVLRLESDYTDGHVGQLMTRIEAFLEMI
ncbi:MAG: 2-hydroxyacyl-CoA dehydratase family protein [Actinomycetota bacterium]|nr:2-hydroxyacyl-CoA dehydratase family protein [Actinomycetota bacterium]